MEPSSPNSSNQPRTPASLRARGCSVVAGTAVLAWLLVACPLLLGAPAGTSTPAGKAAAPRFTRSVTRIDAPDLSVTDQDGRSVPLPELLDRREPVVVNFFFASCGSICPVMTATLSAMREALGRDGLGVRTVSITIDPDQDTPDVLKAYARRFSAGPGWSFVTAPAETVASIQKAFGAETGGKFNHRALFFFRPARSDTWVRIEGLASANDLVAEARGVLRGAEARK